MIEIYDISKFKPIDKKEKIKYLPKKKEISNYDDYIIEDNENFIVINKPTEYQFNQAQNHIKILLIY